MERDPSHSLRAVAVAVGRTYRCLTLRNFKSRAAVVVALNSKDRAGRCGFGSPVRLSVQVVAELERLKNGVQFGLTSGFSGTTRKMHVAQSHRERYAQNVVSSVGTWWRGG